MSLDAALSLLADDPAAPLDPAEVALLVARDEYPGLDVEGYLAELDGWGRELRPAPRGPLRRRVEALVRYLFGDLGFHGNRHDYYDPRNSYLSDVIDRRTGLPILLSLVAMRVGAAAGLTVEGVGLPGHFVARAVGGDEEVLFDPFHGGRLLDREACEDLSAEATGAAGPLPPRAFTAVTPGALILRLLSNLKAAYLRRNDYARAARVVGRLRRLAPHDPTHVRDEGVALLQAGRPGRALGPLREFLLHEPAPAEAAVVQGLIRRAEDELARWN